ncbi:MAG: DUF1385 domain-containing protein [Clostridia bacterium]|nr:DUF1385 domain-containing protein [Clostridia bacterium]
MEEKKKAGLGKVGGQAVLEGIMMRGPESYTTAVRKADGTIIRDSHPNEIKKKNFFFRMPIVRGVVSFVESMTLSFSTLSFAAEALEIEEETKFEKWLTKVFGKSLTGIVMAVGTVLGLVLGVGLFVLLPAFLASFIPNEIVRKILEGLMRIAIFLGYVCLVSLMDDIKRTFMYHGAEHKSIFCYEKGLDLTVENIRAQRRFHPRCGTSFMVLMMLVGIIIGLLIGVLFPATQENTVLYMAIKLLLLPVTMGLGYEIIRYAGRHDNAFIRFITAPGLWIQRITTKEPSDDMIEVAIVALKSALPEEFTEEEVFQGIAVPETETDTEPLPEESETVTEETVVSEENGEEASKDEEKKTEISEDEEESASTEEAAEETKAPANEEEIKE